MSSQTIVTRLAQYTRGAEIRAFLLRRTDGGSGGAGVGTDRSLGILWRRVLVPMDQVNRMLAREREIERHELVITLENL